MPKNGWREASEGILSSETSVPVIKIFLMLQTHDMVWSLSKAENIFEIQGVKKCFENFNLL